MHVHNRAIACALDTSPCDRPRLDAYAYAFTNTHARSVSIQCKTRQHDAARQLAWVAVAIYPVGLLALNGALLFAARNAIVSGRASALSRSIDFLHREYGACAFRLAVMPAVVSRPRSSLSSPALPPSRSLALLCGRLPQQPESLLLTHPFALPSATPSVPPPTPFPPATLRPQSRNSSGGRSSRCCGDSSSSDYSYSIRTP